MVLFTIIKQALKIIFILIIMEMENLKRIRFQ
nr:MAG TPA: hypothetical protein [Caudoviricetes sp.]